MIQWQPVVGRQEPYEAMHAMDSEAGPIREGPADTCQLGFCDRCASLLGGAGLGQLWVTSCYLSLTLL